MEQQIVFIEAGDESLTDKPHCSDCRDSFTEVTDKPHCSDCRDGVTVVTDKPHCSDCRDF